MEDRANAAEAYRKVQLLAHAGRFQEALDLAHDTLLLAPLGRKTTAKLHALICTIQVEWMDQASTLAVLHGEEAVLLADLIRDPWTKCEALACLILAYCRMGDLPRAHLSFRQLESEIARNPRAITGGKAQLALLQATILAAEGDETGALTALEQADSLVGGEHPQVRARIRSRRAGVLAVHGRCDEARHVAAQGGVGPEADPDAQLEWGVAQAWLSWEERDRGRAATLIGAALDSACSLGRSGIIAQCLALQALLAEADNPSEARRLARVAHQRALAAGRVDLVRQFRQRHGRLLDPVTPLV